MSLETGNDEGPRVLVLHRDGCHLCDALLDEIRGWQRRYTFRLETIDIDEDSALRERYNAKVPVVLIDDDVLCCHFLDRDGLADALSPHARPTSND